MKSEDDEIVCLRIGRIDLCFVTHALLLTYISELKHSIVQIE